MRLFGEPADNVINRLDRGPWFGGMVSQIFDLEYGGVVPPVENEFAPLHRPTSSPIQSTVQNALQEQL